MGLHLCHYVLIYTMGTALAYTSNRVMGIASH
jgi:hypothetical protein